jgi:hypothetical protein
MRSADSFATYKDWQALPTYVGTGCQRGQGAFSRISIRSEFGIRSPAGTAVEIATARRDGDGNGVPINQILGSSVGKRGIRNPQRRTRQACSRWRQWPIVKSTMILSFS